jgi:protein SCO1/2
MNSIYINKGIQLTNLSSEEEIGKAIDLVRSKKASKNILLELLSERHSVYVERPNYQMSRIRGYAISSFLEVGLPDSALKFILDELQNGKDAYVVAAAARSLRGTKRQGAQYVSFLLQALHNIRYHDDSMSFDVFKPSWPLQEPTSARKEVFLTFQWLKGYAKGALPELKAFLQNTYDFDPQIREEIQKAIDLIEKDDRKLDLGCCDVVEQDSNNVSWFSKARKNIKTIENLQIENEKGVIEPLKQFVNQKPTVIAFFYTRCMTPNKCTLTINKLGWLQQELLKSELQDKVNLLAFTYDPNYDSPDRMHVFGENRGMTFGPNAHMLRTKPEDLSLLSDFFELGVNYVNSTVNQHRLELFLLDQNGSIKTSYTRLQWEIEEVFTDIDNLLKNKSRFGWFSSVTSTIQSVGFPLLLAFFPKCPVCWAVYLSAFGVSGLQSIPYSPWLAVLIIVAMVINLVILYRKGRQRNGLIPFWLSLVGGILLIGPGYLLSNQISSMFGLVFMIMGALFNSVPYLQWLKWTHFVSSSFREITKRFSLLWTKPSSN